MTWVGYIGEIVTFEREEKVSPVLAIGLSTVVLYRTYPTSEKNMPRVSVIIPTYNHAAFICESLESVFAQTFEDFEVIVVNDGSSDDTEEVLKSYIAAKKITYLFQENKGSAAARNAGLAMATGEWLAFLDDDDLWPADKLAWQVAFLEQTNAVMVGGHCARHTARDDLDQNRGDGAQRSLKISDFFNGNPFTSPGQTLIRRSALLECHGFDVTVWGGDDLDLWMRLSHVGDVVRVNHISLWYRIHGSNASSDLTKMICNLERVFIKNLAFVPADQRSEALKTGYRFLFRYAGKKLIWQGFKKIVQGCFTEGWKMSCFSFSIFFTRSKDDPVLLSSLVFACLKAPWKVGRAR